LWKIEALYPCKGSVIKGPCKAPNHRQGGKPFKEMTYAHPHASLFPFIWIFLETKTQHEK
jgi:hypothetical protein